LPVLSSVRVLRTAVPFDQSGIHKEPFLKSNVNDLRDLRWPRDDWEGLSSVFSEAEKLEVRLEQAGEHWPQWRWKGVEWTIERFWSVAFDLPVQPTAISPLQGFDVMHDWQGPFAE